MGNGAVRVARPTKLDKALEKRICQAIRAGLTYERAAAAAGIHYDTFNEWRKIAKVDAANDVTSIHTEFAEALEQAEAEGERVNAEIVLAAAKGGTKVTQTRRVEKVVLVGTTESAREVTTTTIVSKTLPNVQAAEFILERRHGWTRTERQEVTGKNGGPIQHEDVGLTDAERDDRIAQLLDLARARRDGQSAAPGAEAAPHVS